MTKVFVFAERKEPGIANDETIHNLIIHKRTNENKKPPSREDNKCAFNRFS